MRVESTVLRGTGALSVMGKWWCPGSAAGFDVFGWCVDGTKVCSKGAARLRGDVIRNRLAGSVARAEFDVSTFSLPFDVRELSNWRELRLRNGDNLLRLGNGTFSAGDIN